MAQRADGLNDIFEHNVTVRENLDAKGGTVRDTPTIPKDIVNKEYVDKNIVANVFLFFTENASDIATYYDTQPSPSADAEENIITAIPGNSTGTLMASYATPDGCDCVSGFVELPLGLYSFHVHGLASSANSLRMFGEVYHRTAGGTETLLLTSDDSNLISITKGGIDFHGQLTTPKTWASTDRLVFKIYAKNASPASRNMTIYTEGTTASRCELPAVRATVMGGLWEVDGTETQLITPDSIDMQNEKIINVVDPTANQDSATKKYVDDNLPSSDATIKSWIRFVGSGVVEISDSFNVTSITDNGVGNYTITWDIDFVNTSYAASLSTSGRNYKRVTVYATTALTALIDDTAGNPVDDAKISIIAIGDQ